MHESHGAKYNTAVDAIMAKQRDRRRKKTAKNRKPATLPGWLRSVAILALVLALGYGAVQLLGLLYGDAPGYAVPLQPSRHSPQCPRSGYNSFPPTSGCHSPSQTYYGVHREPIPFELQLHNLEHGAVIVQYRTSGVIGLDENRIDELEGWVEDLRQQDPRYCRLIVAPYPGRFQAPRVDPAEAEEKVIALTAWGRIDLLDDYDLERIREFVDAWINRGPEKENDCSL